MAILTKEARKALKAGIEADQRKEETLRKITRVLNADRDVAHDICRFAYGRCDCSINDRVPCVAPHHLALRFRERYLEVARTRLPDAPHDL